ncbi:hypothetical protein D7Z54_34630 [Salibacterium salarium]|uniref:AAA domain-containing protein n=1 Tax=Salibacterium salarium TaxID=284579 RepID=A0A3R9P2M5_9BACI|nr:hypothetical protein [Salibacterium salarium]RSL28789.1 hypothetical protein D7Z54_34630 [Salibacterium salarium]
MPIICVEGPQAVGKTTVCLELQDLYGACVISNTPFKQPADVWEQCAYQMERWQRAVEKSKEVAVVVLDGDVFSPLVELSCLEQPENVNRSIELFHHAFLDKKIGFPDQYFYLQASAKTIQKRRKMQYISTGYKGIQGSNGYYQGLSAFLNDRFHYIHALHEHKSARQVMRGLSVNLSHRYDGETFQRMRTLLHQETEIRK